MPISSELVLRITVAFRGGELGFTLEIIGSADGYLSAAGSFTPQASRYLSTELQWYLENFLDERDAAALARATRVRESVKVSGKELFRRIFEANAESRAIWRRVSKKLRQTRIEVFENGELSGIPWEILRDSTTNTPLCLSSATFVHSHGTPSVSVFTPLARLRVLLVISRPDGTGDVELRTIASSIYGSLRKSDRFEVDVLRPPTYEALEHILRQAAAQGMAYDLVHFDGHGMYYPPGITDLGKQFGGGYLVFEDDGMEDGGHISGEIFGVLAHECGVKAIVLNACRSAYRETIDSDATSAYGPVSSFAQAALAAGVPAILAMNFNVYVSSAKTYMEDFYRHLQQGKSLSVAASLARKRLSIDRARFQQDASNIDDWLVPALFQNGADLSVEPSNEKLRPPLRRLPRSFPVAPDLGFVGSDDAILQIDRSFDSHNIVLLFGLAGGGKSATSVEFASWYQETASDVESLLFTSFETSPQLTEVLAGVEPELGVRVRGLNLLDEALQTSIIADLAARGAFWVWDNVETVSGLPAADRKHFAEFLQRAKVGGLKILLTARDEQEDWLNDATGRIEMPALRPAESVEMVKRILASGRIKKFVPELWAPLIDFAAGNPLTLRVVISSYLSSTKKFTGQSVASYVDALRRGVAQLDDTYGSDRSKSLTASLNYGFQNAFDARSLKLLSLLSLFRSYANSFTIWLMCKPITDKRAAGLPDHEFDWTIPGLQDETRPSIEVVLDKAVELGLLRKSEDHNYWLHPAVHLHLQPFFEISYPTGEERQVAGRAFAEAQGIFSIQFVRTLQVGTRARSIETLTKEADNLDQALYISHANSWKQAEVGVLHGLNALLTHQGRFEQWRVQFSSVWGDFIGPKLEALPGCEKYWSFVMDHRLRIAMEDQDVVIGEAVARLIKDHEEKQTAAIPRRLGYRYNEAQRRALNDLAISTGRLADVLRQKEDASCIAANQEAIEIYKLIEIKAGIAIRELNLGHCYKNVPAVRDLEAAEKHYRLSIDNYPENDVLARSQAAAQISMTWLDAIREYGEDKPLPPRLKEKLAETIEQYEKALDGIPDDAWGDLANLHNNLANALRFDPERRSEAVDHIRAAHRYAVAAGRHDEAAVLRANSAQLFDTLNRQGEAVAAAKQALQELQELEMAGEPIANALRRILLRASL